MQCEVCGQRIEGKAFKVIIERAKLSVCDKCSKYGEIVIESILKNVENKPRSTFRQTAGQNIKRQEKKPDKPLELVENFDLIIRNAIKNLQLSHEDLGKKIMEKVSVIKKIESGKMRPNNELATKLEHILKVKLLSSEVEEKKLESNSFKFTGHEEATLGDFVKSNEKAEDKDKRKQS